MRVEASQLKKEGIFTIIIGFVLIVIALVLSTGYNPQWGLLASLNYDMYIFNIAVGCEEKLTWTQTSTCEDGFTMMVQTKYVISVLGLLLIYGVGQYLEFLPSLKFWSQDGRE
ncbi:hypothetical protein [Pseudomonas sp. R5(2019)]|uniref:hypothetical protein n=1 Tax=Pseudomonas sp. R5(2019) TaxID=2697566 RepID=UPI001412988E|nr:hypothetical protein [Pseudomonas sp. R5(2019)]NBA96844.1 hypothetical protein [Pseudomonas sp. R5(2019)]